MACNCGKKQSGTLAVAAGAQVWHEVYVVDDDGNETPTGRRFASILQAQSYMRTLKQRTAVRTTS